MDYEPNTGNTAEDERIKAGFKANEQLDKLRAVKDEMLKPGGLVMFFIGLGIGLFIMAEIKKKK